MGYGGSQGERSPHAGRKKRRCNIPAQAKKNSEKTGVTHSNVVELGSTKVTRKQVVETLKSRKGQIAEISRPRL